MPLSPYSRPSPWTYGEEADDGLYRKTSFTVEDHRKLIADRRKMDAKAFARIEAAMKPLREALARKSKSDVRKAA